MSDAILKFISTRWERRESLVLIIIIVLIALLSIFSKIKIEDVTISEAVIIIVIIITIIISWFYPRRFPKAKKGKIGFGLAIYCENRKQRTKLVSDFIITLRDLLRAGNYRHQFFFINFPNYLAKKIVASEDVGSYFRRSRCHFLIYGRSRIRIIGSKEQHVIDLNGIVTHKSLPPEIRKHFATEFNELFPKRLRIATENDLLSLELTSNILSIISKYIIGIASMLSGDFLYTESLLVPLNEELRALETNLPPIVRIRRRLPIRLGWTYNALAREQYALWRATKDVNHILRMKPFLDNSAKLIPNDYGAHLLRAVWHFVSGRDVASALSEIRKCKNNEDAAWRYSYAFLLAYSENMKTAGRMYHSAFRKTNNNDLLSQVEEFIIWVISENPEKIQLHFCLGLINQYGKGDRGLALQDYEVFLKSDLSYNFVEQRSIAIQNIDRINTELRKTI